MGNWIVGAVANAVIATAYFCISYFVGRGLVETRRWFSNPLALATSLIFFSCAVGHALHLQHLLADVDGARDAHDWHIGAWDLLTAAIGVWYLSLRGRFPALVRGAALFEDMRVRERQALMLNDDVVQGITTAKLAFEMGEHDLGTRTLEQTLTQARGLVDELLGDSAEDRSGKLRRSEHDPITPA